MSLPSQTPGRGAFVGNKGWSSRDSLYKSPKPFDASDSFRVKKSMQKSLSFSELCFFSAIKAFHNTFHLAQTSFLISFKIIGSVFTFVFSLPENFKKAYNLVSRSQ